MRYFNLFVAALIVTLSISSVVRALPFEWPGDARIVSGEATEEFEDHYDERFPLKTLGTNLWAAIDLLVFGEGRPGVVVGQEGWLFTDEEFEVHADADQRVRDKLESIAEVGRALSARGIELQVALIPSKARVYPEFLSDRRPGPERRELYAYARKTLTAKGIDVPDLNAAMDTCKRAEQVFLRTDTHWTPEGARCVARKLAGLGPVDIREASPLGTSSHELHGDLTRFLPMDPWFKAFLPKPDRLTEVQFDSANASAADSAKALLGDVTVPELVLIGTSYSANDRWGFAHLLRHAQREDVLNLALEGHGPLMPMQAFLRQPTHRIPRKLIWEIPERYLPAPEEIDARNLLLSAKDFLVKGRAENGAQLTRKPLKKAEEA